MRLTGMYCASQEIMSTTIIELIFINYWKFSSILFRVRQISLYKTRCVDLNVPEDGVKRLKGLSRSPQWFTPTPHCADRRHCGPEERTNLFRRNENREKVYISSTYIQVFFYLDIYPSTKILPNRNLLVTKSMCFRSTVEIVMLIHDWCTEGRKSVIEVEE